MTAEPGSSVPRPAVARAHLRTPAARKAAAATKLRRKRAWVEDYLWMARSGETVDAIAARLGINVDSVEQRCREYVTAGLLTPEQLAPRATPYPKNGWST